MKIPDYTEVPLTQTILEQLKQDLESIAGYGPYPKQEREEAVVSLALISRLMEARGLLKETSFSLMTLAYKGENMLREKIEKFLEEVG